MGRLLGSLFLTHLVGTSIDGIAPRRIPLDASRFRVATLSGRGQVRLWCMVQQGNGKFRLLGDERYYAFSVYLPKGFPYVPSSVFNYIFELHGDHDGQAPVKIGINSLLSKWNRGVGFVAELNNGKSPYSAATRWWRLGPLVMDHGSTSSCTCAGPETDGILEVWRDGVKRIARRGIRTWYMTGQNNVKPALGYYRSDYSQTAALYLDAFRIGSSYKSVAP